MNLWQALRTLARGKPEPPDLSWHYEMRVDRIGDAAWAVVYKVTDQRRTEVFRAGCWNRDDGEQAVRDEAIMWMRENRGGAQ